mmetsp:Transcript_146/g.295  ORF Transcript_146/g.295 Transcript_146/m.295 type:complete len:482 (-) Transcript_146:208-1653(-)
MIFCDCFHSHVYDTLRDRTPIAICNALIDTTMPKSKLKRTSERQISKDSYEIEEEDDRFVEHPDPGQGMSRASEDVIKTRKIVKVRNRNFARSGGSQAAAPSGAPPPSSSSNPFASNTFAKQAPSAFAPQNDHDRDSVKPNPFASVSFASNSNAGTKTTFSFSGPVPAPPSAPSSVPNPVAFSFGSTEGSGAKPSLSNGLSSSTTSQSRPTENASGKLKKINKNLFRMIVSHWEGGHYASNYSVFFDEYEKIVTKLLSDEAATTGKPTDKNEPSSNVTSSPPPAKPFAAFDFGASSAPSAGTFSFTSKNNNDAPAAYSTATAKPTFSFESIPPPSSSAASTTASSNNDDDPTTNPDDGKVSVQQEENKDEDILMEIRAKHLKCVDGKWKKFGAGVLRLYRHKETSKHRMVLRNEIGKVQLNLAVSKGMPLDKHLKKGSKGAAAYVSFAAVENEEAGMERFMLQVKPEELDNLHSTLSEMAK